METSGKGRLHTKIKFITFILSLTSICTVSSRSTGRNKNKKSLKKKKHASVVSLCLKI